jgi:splicing factor 3B subunit 3
MSLQLYSVTLEKPSTIGASIVGQFSGQKTQEIVVARGSWLELLKPDPSLGKLTSVLSYNCFGILRSLVPFRIAGSSKDHIIIGSDSGRITILEYNPDKNTFIQLHLETFGKTGVRRVVPGQYLAVDPKGRATMIASVEKNKLVYVLNRDANTNITISSPLEAHTPRTLVYTVVGVDVGYENPVFAAIEATYDDDPKRDDKINKKLTYYELDLGLNHVIRKWSSPLDVNANILVQVPGGSDGPSGVLVGTDNCISYYNMNSAGIHKVSLPKRKNHHEQPSYIVSAVMHKMKGAFFFLVQSNLGDLFKMTLERGEAGIECLIIKYFDTIPLSVSLNILKSGFLFAATEAGDHRFYQFNKLGDDDDEIEFMSTQEYKPLDLTFSTRELDNIQEVDRISSLNPLMHATVANLTGDDAPQIYTISGQGAHSSFRRLEHGLPVNEVVDTQLPAIPIGLWTTKITSGDEYDKYIVLSFSNETLVLSIGSDSVEEVTDSAFLSSVSTLGVQQLGQDSLLQIHSRGIRHITLDKQINEWNPPDSTYITAASSNNYQVAIVLSNGELGYFEIDMTGQLVELQERKPIPGGPACLSLGEVPEGRVRSSFLAIGCADSTVRILSLDLDNTLETLSVQALTSPPSDIRIMHMGSPPTLYLHIGLTNGVYIMSVLDSVTGELSDTRTRFLGPRSITLFEAKTVIGEDVVLALTTKPWIGYTRGLSFDMVPLSYRSLTHACSFASQDYPQAVVSVEGSSLRIFTIERLGEKVNQETLTLTHTPRRMARNSFSHHFYVVETDNNTMPSDDDYLYKSGQWASAITVVDPISNKVLERISLDNNEAAFSITSCVFSAHDKEYLVVGTAKDQIMMPKSCSGGFIHVYQYSDDGSSLSLLHKTPIEEAPLALLEFQGRLLVGMGPFLRIYDIGLKQLLRKCEENLDLNTIVALDTQGNRIVVGDMRNSLTYVVYKDDDNLLIPFADDPVARHVTSCVMLDYDTAAAGDRFGNIFILKCPKAVSDASDEDSHGVFLKTQPRFLSGAPAKLSLVSHFYVQDIPTSLQRATLVVGGGEAIIYTGLQGTIGALIPFASKRDAEFFHQLESLLRQHDLPITGRDHLTYRGYYAPVKSTIDGDLCERFGMLAAEKQELIANELDRTVREVERKIAEVRIRAVF